MPDSSPPVENPGRSTPCGNWTGWKDNDDPPPAVEGPDLPNDDGQNTQDNQNDDECSVIDADSSPLTDEDPDADADSVGPPPGLAQQTKRKRKGPSRTQRRCKKAAIAAEQEEGGYTDKGINKYRQEGGVLRTGKRATYLGSNAWRNDKGNSSEGG